MYNETKARCSDYDDILLQSEGEIKSASMGLSLLHTEYTVYHLYIPDQYQYIISAVTSFPLPSSFPRN